LIYGIRKYFAPKYIPGIPILKPNSVLGFTLISNQYVMKEYVEKYGSLLQFQLFGKHVILINDKVLAKKALRDVKGKGYFHNPKPSIIRKSTFTLDTGPDWQMRRNIFRKAFSNACLRTQISVMSQTINKLLVHLDTIALSGDAVMIDEVFIQLTIGVICNLGFDLDVKALDSTSNTCTHMNDTLKTVFKVCNHLNSSKCFLKQKKLLSNI
jgi:cytochrome P450